MENFRIFRPASGNAFSEALSSLFTRMDRFFVAEAAEGRTPVFIRFFLSDAQNQADALRKALNAWFGPMLPSLAVSVGTAAD